MATDDPLPVKATLATVLPTVRVVTSTSAESVAVPPTFSNVKVVTPLIFPDAVTSAPVTLFSVVNVKVLLPPVMAAIVMSALLVVVELVSMVTLLPSVTAPKVMASSELLIDVFNVTVPATLDVVSPPLKVKLSPVELPKVKVPSLARVAAALKVLVLPVKVILATVLAALKAAAATLLLKVAVPPTSAKVRLPNPLMAPDAVTSAPAILLPVESVRLLEPPVIAAMVMSATFEVALVSMVVLAPKVTAPKLMVSFALLIVDASVTVPVVLSVTPPLKVKVSPEALPKFNVPVLSKTTALLKVPPPLNIKS